MTNSLLQQGKEQPWLVNDKGEALVTLAGALLTDYDAVSATLAYVGKRAAGSSSSAAVWQIKQLVFNTAGDVSTMTADGNLNFDNVWADRAILTYT